jgi:mono/diheme cytochrome c family protein
MSTRFHRIKLRRLAVLLAAAGAAVGANADDSRFTAAAGTANTTGADVYGHICLGCHMDRGQGAVGAGHYPKLAGDRALVSWQYVALTVLNGKNGMPAFGLPEDQFVFGAVHLSDAQVAEVVNYVRGHFGNKWKGNVTAAQVAALPHPADTTERRTR